MLKQFAVATAMVLGVASGSPVAAETDNTTEITPADKCVFSLVDEFFRNARSTMNLKGVNFVIEGDMEDTVDFCESKTDSEVNLFKGMSRYHEIRGNLKVELK